MRMGSMTMKALLFAILLSMWFFGSLSAADLGGDITPPVLVAATADRYQIDTSQAAQTITFTLRITDDLAGVRSFYVEFRHEQGYNEGHGCQQWPQTSRRDVTLQCAVTWPQYSAEGKWIVTWLAMSDNVGNTTDGNVVDCVRFEQNRCMQYVYNDQAGEVVRALEVQVMPSIPGEDPPLYMPWLSR